MTDFRNDHPRFVAIILIVLGILASLGAYYAYQTGGIIADSIIILGPVCLIYGLAGLLVPRLHLAMMARNEVPPAYRIAAYVVLGLSVLAGLYVRYAIFKDWK